MVKDQYFVLSGPSNVDDVSKYALEIECVFDEIGAARDFAKEHARLNTETVYIVTQRMASFSAFVAVNESK